MKRRCAFCLSLVLGISPLLAQEPSPDAGSFEVEPPLLVQPDGKPVTAPEASPAPNADVSQLEKQLERAKKSAASAERLWKTGVLAKVEAEQRALRVVRLEAELTKARLDELKKSTVSSDDTVEIGDVQQPSTQELKTVLAQVTAAAQVAAANLAKAELDAAILNLQRQKKLLALGSARKSDVARAQERLAKLRGGQ